MNKNIYFDVHGELNSPEQYQQMKQAVYEIYKARDKAYVGDGMHQGINLFEHNAYILLTGEVDTRNNPWAQNLIENWDREQYGLETIYGYSIKDGVHDKGDGQYLVYMILPMFDAEKYRKEVELESHEFSPASDPSILVYADEIEFEALLASVNKRKKPRK